MDNRIILNGKEVDEFTKNPFIPLTPRELIETYPEAVPVMRRNIKILKHEIEKEKEVCYPVFDLTLEGIHGQKMDDDPEWDARRKKMWSGIAKTYFFYGIEKKEKIIRFFEKLIAMSQWQGGEHPVQIEKAKSIPLTYFIKEKIIKCPFHNEKTPSCHIYPDHYHCFGCGAHGDVIDYIMQDEGLDFKTAVARLCKI